MKKFRLQKALINYLNYICFISFKQQIQTSFSNTVEYVIIFLNSLQNVVVSSQSIFILLFVKRISFLLNFIWPEISVEIFSKKLWKHFFPSLSLFSCNKFNSLCELEILRICSSFYWYFIFTASFKWMFCCSFTDFYFRGKPWCYTSKTEFNLQYKRNFHFIEIKYWLCVRHQYLQKPYVIAMKRRA